MYVAYELLSVGRICHLVVLPSSFTIATESGGLSEIFSNLFLVNSGSVSTGCEVDL